MKKLITMALMALMTMGTSVSANEWDKIRIGVEGAYPPFSWVADPTNEGDGPQNLLHKCFIS